MGNFSKIEFPWASFIETMKIQIKVGDNFNKTIYVCISIRLG